MTSGLHDHPGIWPVLPGREITEESRRLMLEPVRDTEWETCWEYKLSHELTEAEGAAFWNGANLAMASRPHERDRIIACLTWIVAQPVMDVATPDEAVDLWIAAGSPT